MTSLSVSPPQTPPGTPHAPLRVVPDTAEPDLEAATVAARAFLGALGVSLDSPGMAASPRRMAAAWSEMLTPRAFDLTTFPNDGGYRDLVLARDVPVHSICEHHLLPFVGVAHVAYLPGDRILGLSKLVRLVELHARRPQVQERLTQEIADWLDRELAPRGVGVVVEAHHQCMSLRGVRTPESSTLTAAFHGALGQPDARAELLALAGAGRRTVGEASA